MRLLIINPNTSEMTNARLRTTALESLGPKDYLEVMSADSGVPLIQTPAQSAATEPAVLAAVEAKAHSFESIIIGAFSDPGLLEARTRVACPVFGICESAMRRAAGLVERFSIVTLGPALRTAIQHNATRYGFEAQLANIRILQSDMQSVASTPAAFEDAFIKSCQAAISEDGAGAIIIGGGPLSGMAKTLAGDVDVPLLDGVQCAVQQASAHA